MLEPTAVQALAEAQETLSRFCSVRLGPTSGLGTTDQVVPFHVSTSVRKAMLP